MVGIQGPSQYRGVGDGNGIGLMSPSTGHLSHFWLYVHASVGLSLFSVLPLYRAGNSIQYLVITSKIIVGSKRHLFPSSRWCQEMALACGVEALPWVQPPGLPLLPEESKAWSEGRCQAPEKGVGGESLS